MPLPKIIIVHNSYQYAGGEDLVFASEAALLRRSGHHVLEYHRSNSEIHRSGALEKAALPARMIWAGDAVQDLKKLVEREKPDIVHFHNTFLMISPAALRSCHALGVPVVQTLHNYRVLCPAATFFRNGRTCEACLNKSLPWPGVWHACYRQSRLQTAGVAAMLTVHRWLKTWQEKVDVYIALSEFARRKFIEGGLPPERIVVKPNFVYPDPGMREGSGSYALFAGRLSEEKGVRTLLKAWQRLPGIELRIAGAGPLLDEARAFVEMHQLKHVAVVGGQSHEEVLNLLKGAQFLVFPSQCYENLPVSVVEAFACGLPVVGSRLGATAEVVEEGRTGLLFDPGNAQDLAAKIGFAVSDPEALRRMGENARRVYEERYGPAKNYQMLSDIYHSAIRRSRLSSPSNPSMRL